MWILYSILWIIGRAMLCSVFCATTIIIISTCLVPFIRQTIWPWLAGYMHMCTCTHFQYHMPFHKTKWDTGSQPALYLTLGAHARGLQYLFCLCVCVSVCFPYSGTSRNQAYKQQYQRLQRDTGMKYKKGFFFKTLRSEVMASFTHLE